MRTHWQRIKFKCAEILEAIFPERYCWADLVMWSLKYEYPFQQPRHGSRKFEDTLEDCDSGWCRRDAEENGSCYCGKFRSDDFIQAMARRTPAEEQPF